VGGICDYELLYYMYDLKEADPECWDGLIDGLLDGLPELHFFALQQVSYNRMSRLRFENRNGPKTVLCISITNKAARKHSNGVLTCATCLLYAIGFEFSWLASGEALHGVEWSLVC